MTAALALSAGVVAAFLYVVVARLMEELQKEARLSAFRIGGAVDARWRRWAPSVFYGGAFSAAAGVLGASGGVVFAFLVLGILLPLLRARERRRRDHEAVLRAFPDFLEMLAAMLAAGLSLSVAWKEAAGLVSSPELRGRLSAFETALALGRSQREAFEALSRRLKIPRLAPVLALLREGLRAGSPLEQILLDQAEALRASRFNALERRAQTAPVRLLFPVLFLIFPTLFIILFGPFLVTYLQSGRVF